MTNQKTIERGVGVALWRQIAEQIRADIIGGRFNGRERLPPESELAVRFGVNRHTVRRAIAALTSEGILHATQGKGTFISDAPISYPISSRTRFSEIIAAQSREPSGRLLSAVVENADAFLAQKLAVPIGAPLHRIESMRDVDGVPLMVNTTWVEQPRFPEFAKDFSQSGSVTTAFLRAGVADYRRQETVITAELVEEEDARILGLPLGQPILVTESVNIDPDAKPIQYARARTAADRAQFIIKS